MADVQRRAAPAGAAQQEEEGGMMGTIRTIANGLLMFFAIQMAFKYLGFGVQNNAAPSTSGGGSAPNKVNLAVKPTDTTFAPADNLDFADRSQFLYVPEYISPVWPEGTTMDVAIYLSESLMIPPLASEEMQKNKVFDETDVKFDWDEQRSVSLNITVPESVKNNGTLWANIMIAKHGSVMDPRATGWKPDSAYRVVKMLTRYAPKKKVVKTKKLIGGKEGEEEEVEEPQQVGPDGGPLIVPHWHANLTVDMIVNGGIVQYNTLPIPLKDNVQIVGRARDNTGRNGWYYPIMYINDFWLLKDHMVEINSTTETLPLHINLEPLSWIKFQIYASMDYSFKQSASQPNAITGSANTGAELEEFKRVLIDTNIYLLGTTFIVSILHTIFEMLAFKNDISHWRNKKDNVGISVRTILANVFMQTIIFLYLMDNSDGTSWMILFGQGMGIVLEAWKITRVVNVRILPAPPGSWLPYTIQFKDKHELSQLEKETKEYDEEAFKYMYWVMWPLMIAYAGYSLLYETHKSWYSFVISTLVGSVYAYGFILLCPGLYINYKLKSVAHMPRKTMVYKLLNTFIDDLFAFTIKMPTLHRLATLRDDVIYFIALYQSWIYRVDYRRINEFGQGGDDDEAAEKKDGPEEAKVEEIEGEVEKASAVEGAGKKKGGKKRK